MPISVTTPVDIREQIALMALHESYTITEVADLFGVTRPTVYKYRDRYRAEGRAGLVDRSKAPRTAHCTDADVVECILDDRATIQVWVEEDPTPSGRLRPRRDLACTFND